MGSLTLNAEECDEDEAVQATFHSPLGEVFLLGCNSYGVCKLSGITHPRNSKNVLRLDCPNSPTNTIKKVGNGVELR
jgi:hypothetical protein